VKNFLLVSTCILFVSCSSTPEAPPSPDWIRQASRTVDAGYIIYVATGEDRSPDQARFKAESIAYEDMANECSFPPKGARTEDRYEQQIGVLTKAYAKVAVDFQSCEEARSALQPDDIHKYANIAMTEQIKRYQEIYERPPQDLASDEDSDEYDDGVSDETRDVLNSRSAPQVAYVSSPVQYYVVRQQVFYAKEDVILSPPGAYPPNAPQTTTFVNNLQAPVQRVQQYEAANPAVKASPQTWTTTHQQASRSYQATRATNPDRFSQNRQRVNQNRPNRQNRQNGQPNRRRRRRQNQR
jgi:hypothetical protein